MPTKNTHIHRTPLVANRVRRIDGQGFCFVPHRFLRDGFFAELNPNELLLYFFLVLVGNRDGISFYHYDRMCSLLRMQVEDYVTARNSLIAKDLIAFDGNRFQVLSLPKQPMGPLTRLLQTNEDFEREDPATVRQIIRRSLLSADKAGR